MASKFGKISASFLIGSLFVIVACDRQSREITGKAPQQGTPEYQAAANIYTVPGKANLKELDPTANLGPDGKALYTKNCSACHQLNGLGVPGAFPPLDGSEYVLSDKTDRMASIMLYGLLGPITVKGTQFASAMAPLGGTLTDEELAAVATYVRSAWSNKAGAVEAKVFTEMRSKWGARGPFNITELGEEK